MIRITYTDNRVQEHKNLSIARFRILETLTLSGGLVRPVMVTQVLGTTTDGISVEMDLQFKLAYSQALKGWMVSIQEIARRAQ